MNKIGSFNGIYRFLSNFWFVDIEVDGLIYKTVEHAYQAAKTTDPGERELIRTAKGPWRAKRLGGPKGIITSPRPDWDKVREGIMLDLLRKKFAVPGLRRSLLATGDAELVEGNSWGDVYWGVSGGHGDNRLGKLLMQVRAEVGTTTR